MTLYRKTNFHPTNLFLRYKGNTEEIAALEEGVKKYGKGKFEKILKSSEKVTKKSDKITKKSRKSY